MANTRSSRHGKRRRQACGLDLSPREVRHEDVRHKSSSCAVECDLVMGELRLFLNTCMQWHRERNPCISHVTKLDSVTMSADT